MLASDFLPSGFNVASFFLDRNLEDDRRDFPAFFCEDRNLTWGDVADLANRCGNALLELGVGIIASMAYDDRKDSGLVRIKADHLFAPNTTSVAVRRGAYLRGYAHAFINMFAPHLSRDTVSSALSEQDRQALAA